MKVNMKTLVFRVAVPSVEVDSIEAEIRDSISNVQNTHLIDSAARPLTKKDFSILMGNEPELFGNFPTALKLSKEIVQ